MALTTRLFSLAAVALAVVPAFSQTLAPGDPVPPMSVASWVKGTPVKSFEPGKSYVVEFWATWCGPCRTSIPHLTELAKKYAGKVTFIGVDAFERGDNIAEAVKKFVDEMGDKMDYNVAMDQPTGKMAETFMTAAAQNGIPTAFIVNDQKVVWIGHPMTMDDPLAQVVEGKFDVAAARAAFLKEMEDQKAAQAAQEKLNAARGLYLKGEKAAGLKALDDLIKDPKIGPMAKLTKLQLIAPDDPKAAEKMIDEMGKAKGEYAEAPLIQFFMSNPPKEQAKLANFEKLVDRAMMRAEAIVKDTNPVIYYYKAMIYQRRGDKKNGLAAVDKAMSLADKLPAEEAASFKKYLEDMKKKFQTP